MDRRHWVHLCVSVVRKSSKWSSWHYVNQSSELTSLYQRLRCVCRAHTSDPTTLQRPQMRSQLRHCPLDTVTTSASGCPAPSMSNNRPPITPPLKSRPSKRTPDSHNEVGLLSDEAVDRRSSTWSNHHHHRLHQYCNCRDLGSLRVCRRCSSTGGFTKYLTRVRRHALSIPSDRSSRPLTNNAL